MELSRKQQEQIERDKTIRILELQKIAELERLQALEQAKEISQLKHQNEMELSQAEMQNFAAWSEANEKTDITTIIAFGILFLISIIGIIIAIIYSKK